jgi:hypothetical protein
MDTYSGAWLLAYDVVLFVVGVTATRMAKFYPGYSIFWITLALGLFIVLIASMVHFVISANEARKREKKQQANIVPGYCPDYWTKTFDEENKNVVCKNGFSHKDKHGRVVTYKFSDPRLQDKINLVEISKASNAYKCNAYGNSIQFPSPWLELKAKCEVVAF